MGKSLRGSWYDSNTTGQGIIIDYDENSELIFLAWFTFQPEQAVHKWFTVSGKAGVFSHRLNIYDTNGGFFNTPSEVETEEVGYAILKFNDCNSLSFEFHFYDDYELMYEAGQLDLNRTVTVNSSLCGELVENIELPFQIQSDKTIIIKDVQVVDVLGPSLTKKSIKISDGLINFIGDFYDIERADEDIIIDGRNRYLLSGLADMHTHLATNVSELIGLIAPPNLVQKSAENQLMLYLANGVTTILNNGDFGEPLPIWSRDVINGDLIGPTIYSAKYARGGSSTCDSGPSNVTVTNAFQARSFVLQAKSEGFDFIKTYNCTPAVALQAILDFTLESQMPVIGHLPQTMSAQQTMQSGMTMIAHAEAFVWTLFNNQHPHNRIHEAVTLSNENEVWVTATLSVVDLIAQVFGNNTEGIEEYWSRPENIYMHPTTRSLNNRSITGGRFNPSGSFPGQYDPRRDFVSLLSYELDKGGVRLLMGTDSPTVLGVPGFSAHNEILTLNNSGIAKADVLKIATKNAGEFIQQHLQNPELFGSIEVGSRADLILLDTNPLENLNFRENILGVMARGRWYSKRFFDDKLEEIATSYGH